MHASADSTVVRYVRRYLPPNHAGTPANFGASILSICRTGNIINGTAELVVHASGRSLTYVLACVVEIVLHNMYVCM
jgi:hypothetical protein